jgi:hypothetical protein
MRCVALMVIAAAGLAANDTLMTLGAGGLVPVKSGEIRMESEDLTISVRQIEVKYVFRNTSARDIEATVAFPLPDLEGGEVTHEPLELPSQDPLNFVDFRVWVDGRPVTAQVEARAFQGERDITQRLRAAGLPVSVADKGFGVAVKKLAPRLRAQLEKEELIVKEEDWWWPNWKTRVRFHWQQRFPAGAGVAVRHVYRPVAGGSYITRNSTGEAQVKPFCGGADALEQIRRWKVNHPVAGDGDVVLHERQIEYILTTARNWSGPIGRFHLKLAAEDGPRMLLTCFPGVRHTGPGQYEMTRENYSPASDLRVLVLAPQR